MKPARITQEFGKQLQDLVRDGQTQPTHRPKSRPQAQGQPGQVVPFMLLEDVRSGEKAKAAKLTGGSAWSKQIVTVSGLRDEAAEFQIMWNEETIENISIYATPAEMQAKLLEFSFINPSDIGVQFGNHSRAINSQGDLQEFLPFRWIIKTRPGLESLELMVPTITTGEQTWMGAERSVLEDSYQLIDVQSILPVGVDLDGNTPMQAGAIGLASYVNSSDRALGWVISSLEARNLTGDFTEIVSVDYY